MYSEQSEQVDQLATALALVQGEMRDADRNVQGHGYNYADLSQVLAIIRPITSKHGISFSQPVMDGANGKVLIETKVFHKSGQWMRSSFSLNAIENKKMSGAQAVGSVITYARRYALAAIFGITQQDDDASNKLIEDVLNEFQLARIRDDEEKAILMIERLPDAWKAEIRARLTKVESDWLVQIQKRRSLKEVIDNTDIIDREMLANMPAVISSDEIEKAQSMQAQYDPDAYGWGLDDDDFDPDNSCNK